MFAAIQEYQRRFYLDYEKFKKNILKENLKRNKQKLTILQFKILNISMSFFPSLSPSS